MNIKVKLEFERCTIPSVKDFIYVMYLRERSCVTSYTYLPDPEDLDKKVFRLENIPDSETFIKKLEKEERRINECIWYVESYSVEAVQEGIAAASKIPYEKRYAKARVRFAFEDCSIPDVLEFVALLPDGLADQVVSYTYKFRSEDAFCFINLTYTRDEFIQKLQAEQMRIYKLIADDKIDPESHDIDYAFAAEFED